MSTPETGSQQRHWGGCAIALVVLGALILVSAGLCTSVAGLMMVDAQRGGSFGEILSALGIPLVFGGPVILVGIVLVWLGFNARRRD